MEMSATQRFGQDARALSWKDDSGNRSTEHMVKVELGVLLDHVHVRLWWIYKCYGRVLIPRRTRESEWLIWRLRHVASRRRRHRRPTRLV